MSEVSHLRCFNHANREAVARCLECSRTFCRECITEHEDRVVCARCLAELGRVRGGKRSHGAIVVLGTSSVLSFMFLWAVFYYLGKVLLAVPSNFHEPFLRLFQVQ
jgi:uncharacterized paraquat-inducible protein A